MALSTVVYVYPDLAFAVSLLMNGLILWGTARINKLGAGWLRILAGAAAGALYAMIAAFPQYGYLHGFWPKLSFSVGMFAIAFAPLNLKRFAASLAVFYILSFALGGFFIGVLYFLPTSSSYGYLSDLSRLVADYFWPGLIITAVAYILLTRFAGRLLQKRLAQNLFLVPLKVLFGQAEVNVPALIDTGNRLQDPLSRIPVVVVEYKALKDLLPAPVQTAFEHGQEHDLMLLLNALAGTPWSTRFRVIPFTSLGREKGLLVGFRPDRIEVDNGGSLVSTSDVIVGVYRRELSPEGGYRALLHPDLLDRMTA